MTYRIVQDDTGSWSTIVDENDRSILASVNGTPVFQDKEIAEFVLEMLNTQLFY